MKEEKNRRTEGKQSLEEEEEEGNGKERSTNIGNEETVESFNGEERDEQRGSGMKYAKA